MKFVLFISILCASLLVSFSAPVVAYGNFSSTITTIKANQQSSKQQLRVKSPTQAAQLAQRRFGGKILKVQTQKSGYKVKLIKNNGHIISVFVNAKSGKISG